MFSSKKAQASHLVSGSALACAIFLAAPAWAQEKDRPDDVVIEPDAIDLNVGSPRGTAEGQTTSSSSPSKDGSVIPTTQKIQVLEVKTVEFSRIEEELPPESSEIVVTGAGAFDNSMVVVPCSSRVKPSLLYRASAARPALLHNDCAPENASLAIRFSPTAMTPEAIERAKAGWGRPPLLLTSEAEYRMVMKWFSEQEDTFLSKLQSAPEEVLDLTSPSLRQRLARNGGYATHSELKAYVIGKVMESVLKEPSSRAPHEQEMVDWVARGIAAANYAERFFAHVEYMKWRHNPCGYLPPTHQDEWVREFRGPCTTNPLITMFKLTQSGGKTPSADMFNAWGSQRIADEVYKPRNADIQAALTIADSVVLSGFAVGATGLTAGAGAAAASISAASSLYSFTACAGAAGSMSAGLAYVGPVGVLAFAALGTYVAITTTVADEKFHNHMQGLANPGNMNVNLETSVARNLADELRKRKGFDLMTVLADGMAVGTENTRIGPRLDTGRIALSALKDPHRVTGALTRNNGKATYLFHADGTYSKTSANRTRGFDPGYPKAFPGGWQQIPKHFQPMIEAALPYNGTSRNYMWRWGEYIRLNDVDTDEKNYPADMPGGWERMPATWDGVVDAAFYFPENKKHYMFNGDEYIRLTGVTVDSGYPAKLPGGWEGMPADFQEGIDAATYRNGHVYMIKGDRYIRFSGTTVDPGYPKSMDYWPE